MKALSTKSRIVMLAVCGCLLLGLTIVLTQTQSTPEPAPYSDPFSLANLRAPHEHFVPHVRDSDTGILISFFDRGHKNQLHHCFLGRSGHPESVSLTPMGANYAGSPGMSDAERAALYAALNRLPPSQPFARDADAFFISWDDVGTWTTRTYDRTKLPPEVRNLCTLFAIPPAWL